MANKINMDLPQSGELKRCNIGGVNDRISDLPDDILSHIQSRLTLKEAVATSFLSRRWNKLGISYPILDFEGLKAFETEVFVQRVDKVLELFKGSKVHKFRIVYPLSKPSRSHVNGWISFAFRMGVSELELNFRFFASLGGPDSYYFPAHVFGKEEMMNPQCASSLTASLNFEKRFDCLKDLCLRSVNLSGKVFEVILFRCSSLERFLLMYNYGLKIAKNTTPHLKLKSLELYFCKDLEKLELLAPNLVSLQYQGRERTLCIKNAQQLASLRLSVPDSPDPNESMLFPRGTRFLFNQFSSYLPMLESLVVSVRIFKDIRDFAELCVFSNLKQLVLDVSCSFFVRLGYQVVASIMRAAPYLELLEIVLPPIFLGYWQIQALELASMSPHQNLKEVKVYGFRGDGNTMEFLNYLLQYAVSLKKIDVMARGATWLADDRKVHCYLDWKADVAEHCKNRMLQFRKTLHGNVQLLFHDK
ncbi:hypothetical protein RDABS01_039902 [Bienertia sinuspersici]